MTLSQRDGRGGTPVRADDCATWQRRVSLRRSPICAVLLAALYPFRLFDWMTEGK